MTLSWNEIKTRAISFSKEWGGESRERAEKDTFWNEFLNIFGISRRRVATFEHSVKKLDNRQGFVDLFWPGMLIVEHKSRGESLDSAFGQALDYFPGIEERELPKYIIVSDFKRFRVYDLDEWDDPVEFDIIELVNNVKLFGFISGYKKRVFKDQDPVNIKAAEMMGKLYDQLKESGYEGHELEVLLVRLLYCLFADDTSIFERGTFSEIIELKTSEDGSDIGAFLTQFFQVLNTPHESRQSNLDENLNEFPYVNGGLFAEMLPIPAFNSSMRSLLLKCGSLDWGQISPAIFGSMFQSVMDNEARRNLGAHYTSEKNILKLIGPLFLDELKGEFQKVKKNTNKLREFHKKLGRLTFLDPACGCGNFLVIVYRELRQLELDVLKILHGNQQVLDIDAIMEVHLNQFYGIEIEEFPARIAEVAMWLIDHQMNMKISAEFGHYYTRVPLTQMVKITHANALRLDWENVVSNNELSFILGNPPFIGTTYQSDEQKEDMGLVFSGNKNFACLDYVCAWYLKSAQFIKSTTIRVGFVSTNSITQGQQVPVLWDILFNNYKMKIHFAHRSFSWTNEGKGKAGVDVVIIGIGKGNRKEKAIYYYEDPKGDPQQMPAKNISPYLIEGPDIFVIRRKKSICGAPAITYGNKPTDQGNFIFTKEEKADFLSKEPNAKKFFRKYMGSKELIHGKERWCLWLKDAPPQEIKKLPLILERVKNVKEFRLKSKKKATQKKADTPTLFDEIRHIEKPYLAIPEVSSENRKYFPLGYMKKNVIASNLLYMLPDAGTYEFGIITSEMHMTWTKLVGGRLESRIRYSNGIIYNNFPWPKEVNSKKKKLVEDKAQEVLNVREKFSKSSLADLYDPLTMPPDLVKAHKELDKAVDLCYRKDQFPTERSRIIFLFDLYQEYVKTNSEKEKNGEGDAPSSP